MDTATLQAIGEYLLGSAHSVGDACNAFGCNEDEVAAAALECDVELCDECGWWHEMGEMVDSPSQGLVCEDCAPEGED